MPTKFDASGKRWVEMEFLVPGTPDQVWQAMATGPGNTAWFTRAEIEERIGGQLTFQFMPGVASGGTVTGWEPPHRFGYVEVGWAENAPPIATEISIVARSGDQCLVRMVHSLFSTTGDWDDQMEGFESGWPGFIEVLRIYLAHHASHNASSFQLTAETKGDALVVWRKLLDG
ncbi:MAG: SRPBCC family protein, partial [Shinella sp.]